MKNILLYLGALTFLPGCFDHRVENITEDPDQSREGIYKLVWQDEFDYTGLPDPERWKYDTEGNQAGWGMYASAGPDNNTFYLSMRGDPTNNKFDLMEL